MTFQAGDKILFKDFRNDPDCRVVVLVEGNSVVYRWNGALYVTEAAKIEPLPPPAPSVVIWIDEEDMAALATGHSRCLIVAPKNFGVNFEGTPYTLDLSSAKAKCG